MNPCITCEHRQMPCGGAAKCVCTISGKPIKDHAESRICPHPEGSRFSFRGLGDVVAYCLAKLGVRTPIKKAIAKATGSPCNCGKRQEAMNKALPFE